MIYTPTIKQVEEDIVLCYYDRQKPLCSPGCKCTEEEIHDCGMDFTMWNNSQKTVKFHPDHKFNAKVEAHKIYFADAKGHLDVNVAMEKGIPADAIKERIEINYFCKNDYSFCKSLGKCNLSDCKSLQYAVLKPLPLPIEESQEEMIKEFLKELLIPDNIPVHFSSAKDKFLITRIKKQT